jgi:hypothetical protein
LETHDGPVKVTGNSVFLDLGNLDLNHDCAVNRRDAKTAWFMLHRIRKAMHDDSPEKFAGECEADETFIGGKARNMYLSKPQCCNASPN